MPIECDVWIDEKTEVGRYEFAQVPRAGETISVPHGDEDEYRHFRVDAVSHRATGQVHKAAIYLFVTKDA